MLEVPFSKTSTGDINYSNSTVEITNEEAVDGITDYIALKNSGMLTSNVRYWTHRNHLQATQFGSVNQFFVVFLGGSISHVSGSNHAFNYGCSLRPIIRLKPNVIIDGGSGSKR